LTKPVWRNEKRSKMGNMSYCRFENTLADLYDCDENMDNTEEMSRMEWNARQELVKLCRSIAESCDYVLEQEYPNSEEDDK